MNRTTFDSEKKIWTGAKVLPTFNPKASVGHALFYMLNRNPKRIAQICADSGIVTTNEELKLKTIRVTQNLLKLGYKQGDIFYILSKNNENVAAVIFAGALIGAPIHPNNPRSIKSDIEHSMKMTKPKIVFCEYEKLLDVRAAMNSIHHDALIVIFDKREDGTIHISKLLMETNEEDNFVPPIIDNCEKEIMCIVSSSGSTGLPKAVCQSHGQVMIKLSKFWPSLQENETLLSFTTLEWITALAFLLSGTVGGATRIITRDAFSPKLAIQLIEKYKVTSIFVPPLMTHQLLNCPEIKTADFSSIRNYICSGSIVPDFLYTALVKLLPNGVFLNLYGSTEIGGAISINEFRDKIGSVGTLENNVQAKILDEHGNSLGIREKGEIYLKGYYPFMGYYNNENSTKEILSSDGWIDNGDIGYFDEDGYLYICDRKKDVFKYNTYHISPTEIEKVVIKCPGVEAAYVVGIPVEVNELIGALIVKSKGSQVTEQEIYDFVASRVIDYKNLRGGIYFVNDLPTTLSGKPLRRKAREIAIEFYNKNKKVN